MNRFVSAALAGAMALSVVGVSATVASADPYWRHHHYSRDYGPGPRNDVGPAIVAGAVLGLAVGSMMEPEPMYPAYPVYPAYAPPPPPPPEDYSSYAADDHFQWCASTYETYNGETDTWTDYRGITQRCISP